MSQTSSAPGQVQSQDSGPHQSLLEENRRLKEAVEETEFLREDLDKERAEKLTLRLENKRLRSSGNGTSSGEVSAQQWRIRAEEAERRALEAERRIEEVERRAEEAERRIEEVEREAERRVEEVEREAERRVKEVEQVTREVHIQIIQQNMENMFAEITGGVRSESVPQDEASEGEDSDQQVEYGDLANEGEEAEYQSHQSLQVSQEEDDDEEYSSMYDPAQDITEVEYAARQACDTSSTTYGGTQETLPPSPIYEHEIRSSIEYDDQGGASKPRVSIPAPVASRSPQESSTVDLKGTSSQPLPLPARSISQPQQHQSFPHPVGETTRLSDQHTPSADDSGKISNVASPLEKLGDMQEALPTLSDNSKPMKQNFPDLPKGSSQIPGIPTASTAPPVQKPQTPVPGYHMASWDINGPVVRSKNIKSFFKEWLSEDESDTEQKPKPEVTAMSPVTAGKQPERPSPVKEASSATKGEPPKSTSTESYAGATVAPPPKVQVGASQTAQPSLAKEASATKGEPPKPTSTQSYAGAIVAPPPKVEVTQTAQPSGTVLKPGNAGANAAVPPAGGPPVNQADENTGFQTVGPRRPQDSSGRGRGSWGRGEAGSSRGGQEPRDFSGRGRGSWGRGEAGSYRGGQEPKFGHWQYGGRGDRGGGRGGYPWVNRRR